MMENYYFRGMSRIFFFLCLLLFTLPEASGQVKPYTSEYWEDHWREWPRPRFDFRIDSFVAVEHIIQKEYFNAGSNSAGERYQQYARFQYPTEESIANWSKILFQLPNYTRLADVDFRIWDKDILVYEARSTSMRELFLDSLVVDPHSNKLFAFSLTFPELKPGHIVEVMISLEGTPLPYHLGFHQSFPIIESTQRIKILSAYPLQYSASEGVEHSEDREFENKFYRFKYQNCKALSPEQGLSTQAAELPGVWIDWLDQIFRYDREESQSWQQVVDHLFYEGELQDYAVYRNSLDREFGLQQYYGSWIRPVRYFHERPNYLNANEAHAEGRWRLTRAYADRWLAVQESLEEIVMDNKVPSLEEGIKMVYQAQKEATQKYIRQIPVYPPVFTEYGLLCSHYERLFRYHRVDYRLALYYPARSGKPKLDYPSPWPAYARGIAWRKSDQDDWQFIFPGPYLGAFLKPGQVPPDFQGGQALLFERDSLNPQWVALNEVNPSSHKVVFKKSFHLRSDVNRLIIRDSIFYYGAMRSILAGAYLRTDSAKDMLGFTNFQLLHNALLSDSLQVAPSQSIASSDTFKMSLDLSLARTLRTRPYVDRSFAIPMVYSMNWVWDFWVDDSLGIKLPLLPDVDRSIYSLKQSLKKQGKGRYRYTLALSLKQCYINKEELWQYQKLFDRLGEPLEIKFWPISNNIGRGM